MLARSPSHRPCAAVAGAVEHRACAGDRRRANLRVLFVGNSLTYVNDLPSTLRALAASQPTPVTIETQTFVAPGGSLADRWNDGKAAAALASGHWDAMVLQERGGVLACMVESEQRSQPNAARAIARIVNSQRARKRRARSVYVLATWGPDDAWQTKLDRAAKQMASRIDARSCRPAKASAPGAVATANGDLPRWRASEPDGHVDDGDRNCTKRSSARAPWPADVTLDFALLPANAAVKPDVPMESQAQLEGQPKKIVVKADAMRR